MTWGEFKKLVERTGIKDDAVIEYIDIYPKHPSVDETNYRWTTDWEDISGQQIVHVLGEHPDDSEEAIAGVVQIAPPDGWFAGFRQYDADGVKYHSWERRLICWALYDGGEIVGMTYDETVIVPASEIPHFYEYLHDEA